MLFMMTFEKLYSKNEPIFWWLTSVLNKNFFAIFLLLMRDDSEKRLVSQFDTGKLLEAQGNVIKGKPCIPTAINFS
jgi:hypothetical protein